MWPTGSDVLLQTDVKEAILSEGEREGQTETDRQRERERQTERERARDRQTCCQTEKHAARERERQRQRENAEHAVSFNCDWTDRCLEQTNQECLSGRLLPATQGSLQLQPSGTKVMVTDPKLSCVDFRTSCVY